MKSLALLFLLCLSASSFGQIINPIDNLSKSDSLNFLTLKQKFAKHNNQNPDSSYYYINKIEKFSNETRYKIGLVEAPYFKVLGFINT